ncbi:MAG TPA: OmpA family protein [Blastocatellia bacterium]|nr:OmpA family protein [Blastocatellia bacterium]
MITKQIRSLAVLFVAAVTIGAAGCAKPKIAVKVSRDRIQQGEPVSVSWTAKDAKAVTLNGEQVASTGSKVFTPSQTTTYTAVARRGKKEAIDSKSVEVSARPARPAISLSAEPDAIEKGQSTTLRWNSTAADQVSISDVGTVPSSGSRVVSPSQSTTYTATATGPGGENNASTRVTVTEAAEGRPRSIGTPPPGLDMIFKQWVQPIFFDYDKADLLPDAKDTLRRAADWLTKAPNRTIVFRIEGNCDPRGTPEYNLGLGERRAQAAREYLVALGVDQGRMQTVSYGSERAVGGFEGGTTDPRSWAHDRRDEFIYVSGGTK